MSDGLGTLTGHSLPDLPYAYDALEPYIDKETMDLMVKKDTWRSMQLANNNSLRTIYNKRTIGRHQRDFSQINFLLFYVSNTL